MFLRLFLSVFLVVPLCLAGNRSARAAGFPSEPWEIHAICDGQSEASHTLFVGADEALVKKYLPKGLYPTAIQYYLVRTPDKKTLLVDTGFGRELASALSARGLAPEDIDAVLLTHMHGDHIGGMLAGERPAFPRARVYLAERERAYWSDPAMMARASRKEGFINAQKVLAAYGKQVQTFEPGELETRGLPLLPGVRAIAAYGHTPGHTLYLIGDEDEHLLIWGDLTHVMAMQMPAPQTAMVYDVDPEQAVATRLNVLQYVSEHRWPVAGMHIPATGMGLVDTGMGLVDKDKDGGYTFIPADFEGVLGHREGAPPVISPHDSR